MWVNLGACLLYKSKGTDFPEKTFFQGTKVSNL